ncbi:hypothetical protein [Streptomyces antarcticus]|uniref:hypothetical protein n=1 Tax=Streptomyces antarcticus TaxID=2996458 RepID=UPI00226F5F64|nr:hypothetical protein [Streptomyces sp. H34-AA3]MCY0945359.1 hypothetical protein [Streptomyces sp. H34-AA3]
MSESPFGSGSPWDEPTENTTTPNETNTESPVTTAVPAPTAAPEGVTVSFKGGLGYDASLAVLRAPTVTDMDNLLEEEGPAIASMLRKMAKIQSFNTELNTKDKGVAAKAAGKNVFSGGRVQQEGSSAVVGDTCGHGRKHFAKGDWEAMFCTEREKSDQCPPAFLDKKTGKYVQK